MKTTMKFFAAVGIMMGFAVGANAQNSVTNNVNANASVQSLITVVESHALEFGTVDKVNGQWKKVTTAGVVTSSGNAPGSEGVSPGIGLITRSGDAIITYKLISPPEFLLKGATSKLPISNYVTAYSIGLAGDKSIEKTVVTDETTVAGKGDEIYVYIGATVTPDATNTMETGIHTAQITLSAEYN